MNERDIYHGTNPIENAAIKPVICIDETQALNNLRDSQRSIKSFPEDLYEWRSSVSNHVDWDRYDQLHGGYNNLVLKEKDGDGLVIYWRETQKRFKDIIRSVLLEDTMTRTFTIPGRTLKDPNVPVAITASGLFSTEMTYAHGERRYPWNEYELKTAAQMLGRLHEAFRHVTFDKNERDVASPDNQLIHGDFARSNILFKEGSADVSGVIDFERVDMGPIEQDLGKSLSLILVDSQIPTHDGVAKPEIGDDAKASDVFSQRLSLWFDNYPSEFNRHEAASWAAIYLETDDYGDLNHVRDMSVRWLKNFYLSGHTTS